MPNVQKILQEEIQRVARKEVKSATDSMRKDLADAKRDLRDFRARIAKLEKQNRRFTAVAEQVREEEIKPEETEVESARISGRGVRKLRDKLGLTQGEFAALVGVTTQSVYQWERKGGRLTFRGNAKAGIVEARKLTKAEARQRIEELLGDAK
ncbi:helix-turn-helix domain-containing protein [bacterium]|nr:helix-turn-helix domain-containing protein [bacterium]